MAPKKKPEDTTAPEPKAAKGERAIIRVRSPQDWAKLIDQKRETHWRRLEVTIRIRETLMAGKPVALDAANAMVKARGLEDTLEVLADIVDPELRAQAAERIALDEGKCEFYRREGFPGLWMPANNIKAGFKENWSVLGLMNQVRGSRKAIAEGVFIFCQDSLSKPSAERDWIYLGDGEPQTWTAVSHSMTPKGMVSAIKRHEFVTGVTIVFDLFVANFAAVEEKLSDDDIAKALIHFCEHGLGACRSQGKGKFDLVQVQELPAVASEGVPKPAIVAA